jgi:predicted RNase H-related nuclease YkuK (DUF458 family)
MKNTEYIIESPKLTIVNSFIESVEYDTIDTLNWHSLSGNKIENLRNNIEEKLNNTDVFCDSSKFKFIVSCDSQRVGKRVNYVTTIVFLKVGYGGIVYYLKEIDDIPNFVSRYKDNDKAKRRLNMQSIMRRRLWNECLKSVKCAVWLDKILEKYSLSVSEIHSDVNTDKRYKSSELMQAVNGYIESAGYISILKPNAWAASSVANIKTK